MKPWGVLALAAASGAAAGMAVGYVAFSPLDLLAALVGAGDPNLSIILWEIRAPRTLLALLTGGGLGISGAALQGLLLNPLAEPGILGVSACAALGAVTALYFGLAAATVWALPALGMLGAALGTLALALVSLKSRRPATLLLSGVALGAFATALTSLALNLAPNPYAMSEMMVWLMGSLKDRSLDHVILAAPFIVAGAALLLAAAAGWRR